MGRFLARRLAVTLLVLWGISALTYMLVAILPGDLASEILGVWGAQRNPEALEQLREEMGLNRPWYERYVVWLGDFVRGDFGYGVIYRAPVAELVWDALKNTLVLAVAAFVPSTALGVGAGVFAGTRPNSLADRSITTLSVLAASVPQYWLGLMLIALFALHLDWLPAAGMWDTRNPGGLRDLGLHLILPALTLAAVPTAVISRLVRSAMIEVMQQDYIRTARAKGLHERAVIRRHAARNIAPTAINIVTLQFGYLISGTIFVEVVFAWPGLGGLLLGAVASRETAAILAITMLVAATFVLMTLIADVAQSLLDPRVRLE
ncbi:MAG: ABC transporter permease [Gammaproteobacteria bacterium]|nr:ABC transporter permease [Gammaproteobacteria bacterium]